VISYSERYLAIQLKYVMQFIQRMRLSHWIVWSVIRRRREKSSLLMILWRKSFT